jgi:hypothetical protein
MIVVTITSRGELRSVEGASQESLTFTYDGAKVTGAFIKGAAIATCTYSGPNLSGIFPGSAKDKGHIRVVPD